jgi:SPP1 gp7 family putative phage head morphogenesis protein
VAELPFFDKDRLLNAKDEDSLIKAIESGKIIYRDGKFSGKFNAKISRQLAKMGAKFVKSKGVFSLPDTKVGPDIKRAVKLSDTRFKAVLERMSAKLKENVPDHLQDSFKMEKFFDRRIFQTDVEIQERLKNITVSPKLTDSQRQQIAIDYTNNMEKYIVDWKAKEIKELRGQVEKHILDGGRYEDLIKTIQKSYGSSLKKAKFLARQETGLLMATLEKSRFLDAGVNKYIWKNVVGSPKHPVRPMHKALDGKIFSFDDPPVTNEKGERNNPGEDFNCRCFSLPIVTF